MICLDASVVGMLISPDERSEPVLAGYERARTAGEAFMAPSLLPFEIASLLRKKELKGFLTAAEVVGAFQFYRGLKIQLHDFDGLQERALSLCQVFGTFLTVYDASYLAVAEKYESPLWTADKRFFRTVSISFNRVVLF